MQRTYTLTAAAWLVAVIGFGALAGCGQKGALYLPDQTPAAQSAAGTSAATGQPVQQENKQKKEEGSKTKNSDY